MKSNFPTWQPINTQFIMACVDAGVIPMRSDKRRCLDYARQLGLNIDLFPAMPKEVCEDLARRTPHDFLFWLNNWGGGHMTRAHLFGNARHIISEIEQMFTDADYWNRNIRKEGEQPINPDPDGQMSRMRARMLKFLDQECTDPKSSPAPAKPIRAEWCPAFGSGRVVEHLWSQPFDSGEGDCRECLWCFEKRAVDECGAPGVEQGGILCDFHACLCPAIRSSMAVDAVGVFCCQEHWDMIERGNHTQKEKADINTARMTHKVRHAALNATFKKEGTCQ